MSILRILGGIVLCVCTAVFVATVLGAADDHDRKFKQDKEARLDSVYTSRHVQDSLRISALEQKIAAKP